jgi:hypothetical protein
VSWRARVWSAHAYAHAASVAQQLCDRERLLTSAREALAEAGRVWWASGGEPGEARELERQARPVAVLVQLVAREIERERRERSRHAERGRLN